MLNSVTALQRRMTHPLGRLKSSGSTLQFAAIQLFLVIAFLGVAAYVGLNTLLQEELQKTVSTAAMFGASSYYDGDTNLNPVKDPDRAFLAAQSAFSHALTSSPMLQAFGTQLTQLNLQVGDDQVTVGAEARLPVPFLAVIGIREFLLEAEASSKYIKQVREGPFTLAPALGSVPIETSAGSGGGGLSPSRGLLGSRNSGGLSITDPLTGAVICQIPGGPTVAQAQLIIPVTDRMGPDVHIEMDCSDGGCRGYIVEACSANECYDVGDAARIDGDGMVVDTMLNGRDIRVIFGSVYIDFGAAGPQYAANVQKATYIKISDDGAGTIYSNGSLAFEPCPQAATINYVHTYHVGTACEQGTNNCPIPTADFQYGV